MYQFQSFLVELSKSHRLLFRTKQLHALIIKSYLLNDPFYATRIIRFYAINGDVCSARKVFDTSPVRSVFLWNSIIRAYAQGYKFNDALTLFKEMVRSKTRPDNFTYACVIRACCENFDIEGMRIVHGGVVVSGLGLDSICGSALVTAFCKLGLVDEGRMVFYGIPEPDLVLWNSMISGCSYCGLWEEGLELFNLMREMGKQPDGYTLVGLMSGIGGSSFLCIGQGIHGFCLKKNFDSNDHVGSLLVSMYSRCKCMISAYRVFESSIQPDLVSWSSLITGYAQAGDSEKALLFFRKLNWEGKKADRILIASVLSAAAQSAHAGSGSEIHGYVLRHGLESEVIVSSALIDMYFKCGFVALGMHAFESMPERNIISYNSIISGLGLHGLAGEAFQMFEEIIERGFRPDELTFSALLCACCHAGLVKDGRVVLTRMKEEFHIQPRTEHYVYMVKLLGMAGELEEAYNFTLSLPKPVDSGIWGALLSCCDVNGNTELAEIVAQHLFENESEKGAYRIMLSNIYAWNRRWDDVKKLRDDVTDGGLIKIPGLSWIGCS